MSVMKLIKLQLSQATGWTSAPTLHLIHVQNVQGDSTAMAGLIHDPADERKP
jgi:hypothetical protein